MAYSDTDRVYDELLLTLIQSGDRAAAERLVRRWTPRLMRTARRLLGRSDYTEDVVQEAWIGICRGWTNLKDPARFPAWAYRILHNKCADRIKGNIRDRETGGVPLEAISPPAVNSQAFERRNLEQAFDTLTPHHRAAAIYYFSEGLTLSEIADTLSIPVGTAKSRIFTARQHLKAALSGDLE